MYKSPNLTRLDEVDETRDVANKIEPSLWVNIRGNKQQQDAISKNNNKKINNDFQCYEYRSGSSVVQDKLE